MKNSLMNKLKNGAYKGLTAGALAFGYLAGCNGGPIIEPVDEVPRIISSYLSPTSGVAPLSVRAQLICSDDHSIRDYTLINGLERITKTSPIDTTLSLNETRSITMKCSDSNGQEAVYGPINVQVTQPPKDQVAFWSNRDVPEGGYNEDIYLMNSDGSNVKRLTTDPGQDLEPTFSPDGKELLFTSTRTSGTAVWRMNADGTNQRDISSNLVERAKQAHWCSNGKIAVAYRNKGDTEAGIGIINPNENSFTSIYSEAISGRIPGWPKWNSDCSEVAFHRYINGNYEIYIMNPDGSNLTNTTNNINDDLQPDFNSDGSKIIFISNRDTTLSLYELNLNNNNTKKLTGSEGTEVDPIYSQDGNSIIFAHDLVTFFNPQIYIMKSDGTGTWTQLTNLGANRYPAWRPKQP